MHAEDTELKDRPINLKLRRDEAAKEISGLQKRMSSGEPEITPEKVARVAALLKEKLSFGPPELRQAYARLVMEEVAISDQEIRISGSISMLARCAKADPGVSTPAVLSFVWEWRATINMFTSDYCGNIALSIINLKEAKASFSSLVDEASKCEFVTITRHGKPSPHWFLLRPQRSPASRLKAAVRVL